jgi:3-oxoadipate enol-lactonase
MEQAMTSTETRFIPGAPKIAVDVAGSGPLVVFMHGIGGNRTNWRDQLPTFAAHFAAVAWDARGYGRSDDYEGPLDFGDFSGDLLRLLDHFRSDRAHLVGLSMGGRIAMDFHERHPERIASLTLCDTRAGLGSMTDEQRREFIRLRQEPLLAGKEPRDIAPAVAKTLVSASAVPGSYERLVESMTLLHKESYLKSIAASVAYRGEVQLEKIRVPTHVVVGADDTLTPPSVSRDMAGRIPGAKLTIIDQAGHLSNIEQPEKFNAAVLGFLRGLG